jgi:predicted anti-sigma-YlaC factor YlaD
MNPMIRCRQAARLLSERLDGPLPTGQRLQLAFHLGLCDGCRNADRQLAFLRAAVRAMDAAPDPPPDPPR